MGVLRRAWNHPATVRRFLKFLTVDPGSTCILFTGTVTNGWGRFVAHGFPECPRGRVQAHRYSYVIFRAPIPSGYHLHHSHEECQHRNCVNAYHLEPIHPDAHGAVSSEHYYNGGGYPPAPDASEPF